MQYSWGRLSYLLAGTIATTLSQAVEQDHHKIPGEEGSPDPIHTAEATNALLTGFLYQKKKAPANT